MAGRHRLSDKPTRELVAYAESKGFYWSGKLTRKGHIILRHPNGGLVVLSGTPRTDSLMDGRTRIDRIAAGSGN